MKQQDIAALVAIVFFAGVFSFFISSKFITPSDQKITAQVVKPITSEFPLPSSDIFNTNAVNPAVRIEIAPNNNNQPFAD